MKVHFSKKTYLGLYLLMVEKMKKRRIGVVGFGHLGEIPGRNREGGGCLVLLSQSRFPLLV